MESSLTHAKLCKEPTAEEMRRFAASFKKEQWNLLCRNPEFVEAVSTDLTLAKKIATARLST